MGSRKVKKLGRILSLAVAAIMVFSCVPASSFAKTVTKSYAVGTYEGESIGYDDGKITVKIEIADEDGERVISNISAEQEAQSYWDIYNLDDFVQKIKENNGTDGLDVVSRATISCNAIIEAADNALAKAEAAGDTIVVSEDFDGGDGSEANPYIINTKETLLFLQKSVSEGESYQGKYIALGADIDMEGVNFNPIGETEDAPFAGHFDGNDKKISNLAIGTNTQRASMDYAGLFGYAKAGSSFENIDIENLTIYANSNQSSKLHAGGIVAFVESDDKEEKSTVNNCHVQGIIDVDANEQDYSNINTYVGGIVGSASKEMTIANSGVDLSLKASSNIVKLGGILGYRNQGVLVINCMASGDIAFESSNEDTSVGGVASGEYGLFYNNYADVKIDSGDSISENVGAIIGYANQDTYVDKCYFNKEKASKGVGTKSNSNNLYVEITGVDDEISADSLAEMLSDNLEPSTLTAMREAVDTIINDTSYDVNSRLADIDNSFLDWTVKSAQDGSEYVTFDDRTWVTSKIREGVFESGDGTKENPYIIATEQQFRAFAKSLNRKIHYADKYIELASNIDVSSEDWIAVGESKYYFDGIFNGAGYTVTGMKFGSENSPAQSDPSLSESDLSYYSLFGDLGSEAVVKNLNIDNVYVNAYSKTAAAVAGLAGYAEGSLIDNVHVTNCTVKSVVNVEQNNYVAGLVDVAYQARIVNSSADVDLYGASAAWSQVAGLVAQSNRSLIANCFAKGTLVGGAVYPEDIGREIDPLPVIGGIVGMNAGTLVNSYSNVDIKAERNTNYIGGVYAWVTFLGEAYQTYYATDGKMEIVDSSTGNIESISPAKSVGAIMRPGTFSYSPQTGAIELDVTGYTKEDLSSEKIATKLNNNLKSLNVDIANGARSAYYWEKSESVANNMSSWTVTSDGVELDSSNSVKAEYDSDTESKITSYIESFQKTSDDTTTPTEPGTTDSETTDPNLPDKPSVETDTSTLQFTAKNGLTYSVTSADKKTVSLTSVEKNVKGKVTIPSTVKYGNVTYKVIKISNKAFYNNKKVKEIVVGKNVTSIGTKAFSKTSKLKKITFKTKSLKKSKIAKSAFSGIKKSVRIKVPSKKRSSYKKIFRSKGLNKRVVVR